MDYGEPSWKYSKAPTRAMAELLYCCPYTIDWDHSDDSISVNSILFVGTEIQMHPKKTSHLYNFV